MLNEVDIRIITPSQDVTDEYEDRITANNLQESQLRSEAGIIPLSLLNQARKG